MTIVSQSFFKSDIFTHTHQYIASNIFAFIADSVSGEQLQLILIKID